MVGRSDRPDERLLLLTPTGEVDEEGFPILDVTVLSEKGKRTTGDICPALA